MHLLNITNFDYGMMTGLFLLILAVSYKFRRLNPTSSDFLLAKRHKIPVIVIFGSLLSIGLIEFICLSSYAAYAGLTALYLFIPLFLLSSWLFDKNSAKSPVFSTLNTARDSSLNTRIILICYILFMLLAAGSAISIVVAMFKSLLGWEFGNSALSLLGITLVGLIIGGLIATVYNHSFSLIAVTLLLSIVCFLAYNSIGGGNLTLNLQQAAINNKLPAAYFLIPELNLKFIEQAWLVFIASWLLHLINPLYILKYKKLKAMINSKNSFFIRLCQMLCLIFVIWLGIFALAAPSQNAVIAGKKIITQQTRFDDGTVGYVVKAVAGSEPTMQRGLVPTQSRDEEDSSLVSSAAKFDFISAGMVMVYSVLPKAFVSLFILVLLFYKAITESISFATIMIIRGFYAPRYNKTGEDLENLWAARVFQFALTALSISIGLVLFKYIDIIYMLVLLFILGMPLGLNLVGLSRGWLIDLIAYLLILIAVLGVNISGIPSLFKIFYFKDILSFMTALSVFTVFYYITSYLLLTKAAHRIGRDNKSG